MRKFNIRIVELNSNGREWISTHKAQSEDEAFMRAIKKHFGKNAHWFSDSSLGTHYGQVTIRIGEMGHSCITDRSKWEVL